MDIHATAQLLGNFGEFLGSIAVLATLIYVAVQVKQAKHQLDLVGLQTRATQASSVLQPIVTSSDFAQIFAKLNVVDYGDYGLTPEETARFGAWFHTWLQTEQGSFYMLGEGRNDPLLAWMLSTPTGSEFWEKNKGIYDAPFVERVEHVKAKLKANSVTQTEVMTSGFQV